MEQIKLATPASIMEGTNSIYLLNRGGEVALIDTGIATDAVRIQLEEELEQRGISVADIDVILLTHGHSDHTGLVPDLQHESGATVYIHEADSVYLERKKDGIGSLIADPDRFERWGVPSEKYESSFISFNSVRDTAVDEREVTTKQLTDGETITIGGEKLEVSHTPGHTPGSVVYLFDGENGKEAFTGDTLLPTYTPNIGGDPRMENPLEKYLNAMQRLADCLDRAWPGHRDPITDPHNRAREIINHHQYRSVQLLELLFQENPIGVWELAEDLFESLDGIHIMLGVVEVAVHLEYLVSEGAVKKTTSGYRPLSSVESIENSFPSI